MNNVYIAVLEIDEYGITEKINEKIDATSVYKYDGFEFKIINCDKEFFQLSVYVYNPYITQVLFASIENCGLKVGGKYDIPIFFTTDGGFAGVLCSYIFMISKKPILKKELYQSIGIEPTWKFSVDSYKVLENRFAHLERVVGFEELIHYIEKDQEIFRLTEEMVSRTQVYTENFYSNFQPDKCGNVKFQESLTLLSAKEAVMQGKHTAVLNFANPVEPGGGVLRGAKSQEENICRSSNLYKALVSKNTYEYYQSNKNIISKNQFKSMFLGTDKVIYSPDVRVLKENVGYHTGLLYLGNEQYIDQSFNIDVITCGAPFFSESGYILPDGDLQQVLEKRIRNIFEVAIDNEVEVIILGAFGCGAFHNPPNIVADAFREVLLETRYKKAFDEVIFAVKRTDIICPNIEAFEKDFSLFPNLNFQGREKLHRDLWKWECGCGFEHSWDVTRCNKCKVKRNNCKMVRLYSE